MSETSVAPAVAEWLDPGAAHALLRRHGVPAPEQAVVGPEVEAAVAAAERLGYPVVLKAVAPGLVHRSDRGAVKLNLGDASAVRTAVADLTQAIPTVTGWLVQRQAAPGLELIVGLRRDPVFGPVVVAGLGGVWVEALADVVLRLAPVSPPEARAMLTELRGARLLDGYRGGPAVDVAAVAELIARVSGIPEREPRLLELDLNPVIVSTDSTSAVDARVLWAAEPLTTGRDPGAGDSAAAVRGLLAPRSIVVVGASDDRRKQGGRLFHYLLKHGFGGPLYAVNPRAEQVMGRPCFPSVTELPETPDLACIMVPAEAVPGVVAECGRRGIGSAVVYTSGFAEMGEAGAAAQRVLVETARASGVRLCGPNTAGVVNVDRATCAAFGMAFEVERMPPGRIAFLTQSGALGSSLLSRSWAEGLGFSHWVCTGNEADLTLADYLLYLVDDDATNVIAVFMESVKDPARFAAACERARARGKPIVVYKTGASEVGQRAVRSHTALLAGDDRVYDAAFQHYGVVRVPDLQALVDAAQAFAWLPLPRGRRVAVVSASGGACSVIADECARQGLALPLLPEATVDRIKGLIPPFGAAQNPIDVTIQITVNPAMVGQVADVLLAEPDVDAVIVLMTTNAGAPALEVAKGVVRAARASEKPLLVVRVGAEFLAPESVAYYREQQVPLYPMPDRAVKALRAMVEYAELRGSAWTSN